MSNSTIDHVKKVLFQVPAVQSLYENSPNSEESLDELPDIIKAPAQPPNFKTHRLKHSNHNPSFDSEPSSTDSHSDSGASATHLISSNCSSSSKLPSSPLSSAGSSGETHPAPAPSRTIPHLSLHQASTSSDTEKNTISTSFTPRTSQDSSAILSTRSLSSISLHTARQPPTLPDIDTPNILPSKPQINHLTIPTLDPSTEAKAPPTVPQSEIPPVKHQPTLEPISEASKSASPPPIKPADICSSKSSSIIDLKTCNNHYDNQRKPSVTIVTFDKLKSFFARRSSVQLRKDSVISINDDFNRRESQISYISRTTDIFNNSGGLSSQNNYYNDSSTIEYDSCSNTMMRCLNYVLFCGDNYFASNQNDHSNNSWGHGRSGGNEYSTYMSIEKHTFARVVTVLTIVVVVCLIVTLVVKYVQAN